MAWWCWAIVGFGGLVAELLLPAFVLLWFGLSGLLVMGLVLLAPELTLSTQILIWSLLSIFMVAAWFFFFKAHAKHKRSNSKFDHIIGEVGLLVQTVSPAQKGKVRFQKPFLGSDLWDCTSDTEINVGDRVKITSYADNILTVTKTGV